MRFSWRRVWAIMLRHLYNFYHSWDRLTDSFYWPAMDVIIWGLTFGTFHVTGEAATAQITMILIGIVLWYVVWRGQYEITVNILEELWSDNIGNLFSTPISLQEWTAGLLSLGVFKLLLTVFFTSLIAYALYHVNFFVLGWNLFPLMANLLLMGWWFGLFVAALFLRYGTKIQTLAWAGAFMLNPFSAPYYPLSILPSWAQTVASFVPASYVFENMRTILSGGELSWIMMGKSFGLNVVYFGLALMFYIRSFRQAQEKGLSHLK